MYIPKGSTFKFEWMRLKEESLYINGGMIQGSTILKLTCKLRRVRENFKEWNKTIFRDIFAHLKNKEAKLEAICWDIQQNELGSLLYEQARMIMATLNDLYAKE